MDKDPFLRRMPEAHWEQRDKAQAGPLDAVKWCGTETRTDEEWARLRTRAEMLAPLVERERAGMVELIDGMIAKTSGPTGMWSAEASPDPIADIKAMPANAHHGMGEAMTNSWDWINEEFSRSSARVAEVPRWARPIITRPLLPATPPRKPLHLNPDRTDTQQRMQGEILDRVGEVARRRRDQVDAHLERNWAAIQDIRARGVAVWLEESQPVFESDREGDRWTMRATATVRIRFTGDGVGE